MWRGTRIAGKNEGEARKLAVTELEVKNGERRRVEKMKLR
jgi:hypothetical protein